ncbi:MAG: ParB/RepB/Spo0J family partition protein [Actinomycetota bacterium]|nr:ParB/RepB/Spo0J family partition protein [Actinomycetota bacterium]
MSDRRRGLGRGLGALIPSANRPEVVVDREQDERATPALRPVDVLFPNRAGAPASAPVPEVAEPAPVETATDVVDSVADELPRGRAAADVGAYFVELPVTVVHPNPRQPRQVFDEDAMTELVASIREVGLLQPVVVRPAGEERYELVMGERRLRAARAAGLETVPAIVRELDDEHLLRDALLENLHRSELNPLEEAAAYDQLLQDFGCTHEELAGRLGRSRPQISNTLRLLRLPPTVQRRIAAGVLSAGHARALLALDEAGAQELLAGRIVAEGLSVRTTEELVTSEAPPAAARRARGARPVSPRLTEIAARLSDRFDTRVKLDLGRRKGKIVVEFASIDDLERILGRMEAAPDRPLPPGEG